jgi:molybdate transport system ATP-binding protein
MSVQAKIRLKRGEFLLAVDLSLPADSISVVFGRSGSGKTSLLRSIAGLESGSDNRIRVSGSTWQDDLICLPVHERRVGFVFQDSRLFSHLRVAENIRYGMKRSGANVPSDFFDRIIKMLEISHLLERLPEELSGGETQRVALARVLAPMPDLLLLDEPLASLDAEGRNNILPFISRIRSELKISVVYVTHSLDDVVRIADWLILLEAGQVASAGPVNDILTNPELPLVFRDDASSILTAHVVEHDQVNALDRVEGDGFSMWVTSSGLDLESIVRLRVAARDVSLTLRPAEHTSILNVIPAEIKSISAEGKSRVLVTLAFGKETILARITRRSATSLNLQAGTTAFAQIKGVAIIS